MTEHLWSKPGSSPPEESVQRFLSREDLHWDGYLFPHDIAASQAHARGLQRIGVLTGPECESLVAALDELGQAFKAGQFELRPPHEDGHSAIESYLTEKLGDVGRKIHTGRSRNDQVQVAMRLYLRDALDRLIAIDKSIAGHCLRRNDLSGTTPMPGYTHLQRAVPSSLEMWFAAYAEAFIDAAELSVMTRRWLNASPLGTAAGYGINLPLDRDGVAQELGFDRLQVNPIHAQNSRGQIELQVLASLSQATLSLRRLAWDLSLFACEEFAFVRIPTEFATGSSLMPNKSNPDTVELLRAQHAVVQGAMTEVQSLLSLPSGYHRDLQLTKAATLRAIESSLLALKLVPRLVAGLSFDAQRMRKSITPKMYATDVAIERVYQQGIPFREAYRRPIPPEDLAGRTPEQSLAARVSPGASADLLLSRLAKRLQELS